jgi:uncharacterized membrane protein
MIPQSGLGRSLFFLLIALTIGLWLLPLAFYDALPERVPVHFDLSGNPDRWAERGGWEMWVGPITTTFMAILCIVLLKFPGAYNVPRKAEIAILPPAARARLHDLMREMMLAIFVCIAILMGGLNLFTLLIATGAALKTPWALIVLLVTAPLAVAILYLYRITRAADAAKTMAGR